MWGAWQKQNKEMLLQEDAKEELRECEGGGGGGGGGGGEKEEKKSMSRTRRRGGEARGREKRSCRRKGKRREVKTISGREGKEKQKEKE